MDNKINIMLVDDHAVFLEGLEKLLSKNTAIRILEKTSDVRTIFKTLETQRVDIVISDIDMPELSGLDLTKMVVNTFPQTKVIVLSMHREHDVINHVIDAGASGYMLKDSNAEDLFDAIQVVMEGKRFYCKHSADIIIKNRQQVSDTSNQEPQLSEREKDILQLIAQEFTQNEIAEKLHISPHTVVFHKRKLINKLEVKGTAGLVRKAVELGLLDV